MPLLYRSKGLQALQKSFLAVREIVGARAVKTIHRSDIVTIEAIRSRQTRRSRDSTFLWRFWLLGWSKRSLRSVNGLEESVKFPLFALEGVH